MLPFLTVMRLAFTDAQTAVAIARAGAHIPGASGRTAAHLRMCVDVIGRLKGIGEDRIGAGALERRIGLILIFSDDEQLGPLQASHQQFANLQR